MNKEIQLEEIRAKVKEESYNKIVSSLNKIDKFLKQKNKEK